MKVDDSVTLRSGNGIAADFVIEDIYNDSSILLNKPQAKVLSSLKNNSITLKPFRTFDRKILRPNDLVQIKLKNGKTYQLRVELIINKDFLILGPVCRTKRIGFLNKLKLLWG